MIESRRNVAVKWWVGSLGGAALGGVLLGLSRNASGASRTLELVVNVAIVCWLLGAFVIGGAAWSGAYGKSKSWGFVCLTTWPGIVLLIVLGYTAWRGDLRIHGSEPPESS